MTLTWTAPDALDFWDGYLDWTGLMQDRRQALLPPDPDGHAWAEPIFVRLRTEDRKLSDARAALRALVNDPASDYLMDPEEYRRLSGQAPVALPDEYALYRRLGADPAPVQDLFEIIDIGVAVDLDPDLPCNAEEMATENTAGAADAEEAEEDAARPEATPIIAILDDGLGFLNARFRRKRRNGGYRTRFQAVWLQSLEQTRPGADPRRAYVGTVLKRREINQWLATLPALDESQVYGALNAQLFPREGHRSTDFSQSHGTLVLDLAAGADPDDADDPVTGWPLLGVQLPPQAIADTSGTHFESYMVQGVRWILAQAARIDPEAPVIINISLGMLAGPKDGTRFTDYQIAREACAWQARTGQPVRVVWSFGNNRLSRQVATLTASGGKGDTDPAGIVWRAQPDDLTPSYVEIRPETGVCPTDLEVSVTTPDGTASGFAAMQPGQVRSLVNGAGEAVARLYLNPGHRLDGKTEQQPFWQVALAPTNALLAGDALAPAGGWRLVVRSRTSQDVTVHLQIQRGDSLPSYRPQGRQSYFDSPDAYAWDPELQNYWGLAPGCPITRDGTFNALASVTRRQIFSVGAAEWDPATATYRAPDYTSVGADWSVPQPTAATRADDSRIHWGVLASGTISGSVFALDGTSAAAGRLTRALGLSAARIVANTASGNGTQMEDLDPGRLDLLPVPPGEAAQLGAAIVTGMGGARPRTL